MSYKIIVDSSCDLTKEMKEWDNLSVIPLTLQIGDYIIQDTEDFNQDDFIRRMMESKETAKSACPSPDAYSKACEGEEDDIYIVTLSAKLSGSYNSAVQGANFYNEENEKKNIHVFNSCAAAGLETLLALKIKELADLGTPFEEVVKQVEDYSTNECGLYFCLESLDALKNNGRLFTLAAKVIEAVKIKLICARTTEGTISLAGKDLTENRALNKLVALMVKDTEGNDLTNKEVIITHICCEEKANKIANLIKEKTNYEKVTVLKGSGLNTLYASNNGIIVSFSK